MKKIVKPVGPCLADIPRLTDCGHYQTNVAWGYLEKHIASQERPGTGGGLDLNPDFQRGYVWTPEQKSRYCEYILRGGHSGRDLYFNCIGWRRSYVGPYVIVDGKQRLDAVRGFLHNEVPVFGHVLADYSDGERALRDTSLDFIWHVNDLKTRAEVLQWYVDLNAGGTIHTADEIYRVKAMLAEEKLRTRGMPL